MIMEIRHQKSGKGQERGVLVNDGLDENGHKPPDTRTALSGRQTMMKRQQDDDQK